MTKSKGPPKELWANIYSDGSIFVHGSAKEARAFSSPELELRALRYVLAPQPKPARKSKPARARRTK